MKKIGITGFGIIGRFVFRTQRERVKSNVEHEIKQQELNIHDHCYSDMKSKFDARKGGKRRSKKEWDK